MRKIKTKTNKIKAKSSNSHKKLKIRLFKKQTKKNLLIKNKRLKFIMKTLQRKNELKQKENKNSKNKMNKKRKIDFEFIFNFPLKLIKFFK